MVALVGIPLPVLGMGGQFGLEFAIDAPWRLEPLEAQGGGLTYGAIPISVTFHDAIYDDNRDYYKAWFLKRIHVGTLKEIEVTEWVRHGPGGHLSTTFQPRDLREIERQAWISTPQSEPAHKLCSPLAGGDCADLLRISQSHAWHAALWYKPRWPVSPGRNIQLQVTVRTEYGGEGREFTNYLVVHAGEAPLPRFGSRWIYGDLHYHGQMTDNEGESGYSYRNVLRALGAMGMDFVFATDHASAGKQVDGHISVKRCGSVEGKQCPGPIPICRDGEAASICKSFTGDEARDLNPARFAVAKDILYGWPGGANFDIDRDIALGNVPGFTARRVVPQVYLGEEVDAWPEMSAQERSQGWIHFGDGFTYPWPDNDGCLAREGLSDCRARYSEPYKANDLSSYLVRDEQGVPIADTVGEELDSEASKDILTYFGLSGVSPQPSRQHLVYFPRSDAVNRTGFVASNTTAFGGASRRLEDVIAEIEEKGVAFLAHPVVGQRPGSIAAPDIVPYSRRALNRAWKSPAMLGLQFWNEDAHVRSPRRDSTNSKIVRSYENSYTYLLPWVTAGYLQFPWRWKGWVGPGRDPIGLFSDLYHGAFTWDLFLRKGLNKFYTRSLGWLPPGEPRKWFMAGGSDAHGDFNYRREGRPCKQQWCDSPVVDTAIGKPRNLVLVDRSAAVPEMATGTGQGSTRYVNREVINALAAGRFAVTDGPALRLAVDRNRNGQIDLTDFQMGETFSLFPGEHVPVLIEWESTPEFGPVRKVDLYVGNPQRTFGSQGSPGTPTFARLSHGPRTVFNKPEGSQTAYASDPADVLQVDLKSAADGIRLHGKATIFLSPKTFELATEHGRLFYIRAFAQADGQMSCQSGLEPGSCGTRLAYTNPIWGRYIGVCQPDPLAIDADGSGLADICERDVRPCGLTEVAPPDVGAAPPEGEHEEGDPTDGLGQGDEAAGNLEEEFLGELGPSPANKPAPTGSCKFIAAL
jgi:hypothetical protein